MNSISRLKRFSSVYALVFCALLFCARAAQGAVPVVQSGPFEWIDPQSGGHITIAVHVTSDDSMIPPLYRWDYEITNISYNPAGGNGLSDFTTAPGNGVPNTIPPVTVVEAANLFSPPGWGPSGAFPSFIGWAIPVGAGLKPGETGHFGFTSFPREVITTPGGFFIPGGWASSWIAGAPAAKFFGFLVVPGDLLKPSHRVEIGVDWNRDGKVNADDNAKDKDGKFEKAKPVDFLAENGALVLVNCDNDGKRANERDMDDGIINGDEDKKDMSPLSLELKQDLQPGESLHLVIKNADPKETSPWANVMDPMSPNKDVQILVGRVKDGKGQIVDEEQIDNFKWQDSDPKELWLFPDGKKKRYDDRFLIEGLRFAKEVVIRLEIRRGLQVVDSDEVRILNCPWLANNNTQPLADKAKWDIPGNLTNSKTYSWAADHGATRVLEGHEGEFVQDSVEWGFQVRRQKPADDGIGGTPSSRTMITALRLYTDAEDQHPNVYFRNGLVGVYGYADNFDTPEFNDEKYFEKNPGDAGGNLECLPPTKDYPFGRIVHGNTMTQTLRDFLARQKVQVDKGGAAVVLDIGAIKLMHVDEILCIIPTANGYFVAMPDWTLAKALMKASKGSEPHNVFGLVQDDGITLMTTYDDIIKYLEKDKAGIAKDKLYIAKMEALQMEVNNVTAPGTVVKLPGMFFDNLSLIRFGQGSFPRNIANSQPTVLGKLVVPEPPEEGKKEKKLAASIFLTEWQKILKAHSIAAEPENITFAWKHGGEVHCSSNAIREPFDK